MITVHGTADRIVPHNQSELLKQALEQKGCSVTLITIERQGHTNLLPYCRKAVLRFLRKHCGRAPNSPNRNGG